MYKQFVPNTALTAEDVNDYLMEQAVMVFDDASQRTAQLPSPQEGMTCYLKTTDRAYFYDGSSWIELMPATQLGLTARPVLVCTSTTRPSHAQGRVIFETDTRAMLASDGTAWTDMSAPIHEEWTSAALSNTSGTVTTAYVYTRDTAQQVGTTGRITMPANGNLRISNPSPRDEAWLVQAFAQLPAVNSGRGFLDVRGTAGGNVYARSALGSEDVGSTAVPVRVPAGGATNFYVATLQSTGSAQSITLRVRMTRVG